MKTFDILAILAFAFVVALVAVAILSHSIKPIAVGLIVSVVMIIVSGFFGDDDDEL